MKNAVGSCRMVSISFRSQGFTMNIAGYIIRVQIKKYRIEGDGLQVVMDVCLLAFLSAAVWMDFRSYKVSNTLIAAALASGLTFNLMLAGLRGAAWAMAGCLLLFILLFPPVLPVYAGAPGM